jgi:hypothetical protein
MIARMNDNKNGMYMNNETFEVVNYDDYVVYLITERPNDVGELNLGLEPSLYE